MKTRRRKTTRVKRARAQAAARRRARPRDDLQQQLARSERELAKAHKRLAEADKRLIEALERQTATSEVLRVVSSSPGELEPVFEAMLGNATRLCQAEFGVLYRSEGDAF